MARHHAGSYLSSALLADAGGAVTRASALDRLMSPLRAFDARCGEPIHLAAAVAACAALPIGAASSSITLVILGVVTLARLPWTWRHCLALLRAPTVVTGVAFCGLAVIALAWSPDVPAGLAFLKTSRFLALVLMLWPVLDRVGLLVTATLTGVAIQNLIQISGFVGLLPAPRWEQWQANGGLSKHAGHMGTWSAAAVLWHLAAIRLQPLRMWWRRGVPLLLATLGVAIGAGAAPLLGLLAGVTVLLAMLVVRGGGTGWRRSAALVGCSAAVVVLTTVALPTTRAEIAEAWAQVREHSAERPQSTSVGQRVVWWSGSVRAARSDPWFGAGTGGFRTVIAEDERAMRAERSRRDRTTVPFVYHDPHNTLLLALVEQGAIGALLLLGWFITATVQAARDRWDHPTAAAALPVLCVWFVAGTLESLQSSGILMALGLFVIAITLPGRSVHTAGAK